MVSSWKLSHAFYATAWLAILTICQAEKKPLDIELKPTDQFIHYTEGLIRGPGKIDLGDLKFVTVEEPPNRNLQGQNTDGTVIDIAEFHLPYVCARSNGGCDFTALGVGAKVDGEKRWCCTDESVALGMCEKESLGRLIINTTRFTGSSRFIEVPKEGVMSKQMRYGELDAKETGQYAVVFSNCDAVQGREINVAGEAIWKSVHGYLPGQFYGFMIFNEIILALYVVLFMWYSIKMRLNKESRIPIEKWILMTMILGIAEMLCRTSDFFIWNIVGHRNNALAYCSIIASVLKRGISRCLIVMVSLGWGVVRDSLGSTMRSIVILGLVYIGLEATVEIMIMFLIKDVTELSYKEEVEIFDVVEILSIALVVVDVIFVLWILDALNGTMEYLENMMQNRKLMRYLKLRCIFLFAILIGSIRLVFQWVDKNDEQGIVIEEHQWVITAGEELNYLFVLIGVAILWVPSPNSKEYSYVMELPSTDDEKGENELELSGYVPSALDDDDDESSSDSNHQNGDHYDDEDDRDNRFQIN